MTTDLSTETQELDRDAIACRAYELYVARGCEDGNDIEDWLTAERLLREESPNSTQPVAGRESTKERP